MPAPVASGWSGRRVGLAPTGKKAPPCHGARGNRTLASCRSQPCSSNRIHQGQAETVSYLPPIFNRHLSPRSEIAIAHAIIRGKNPRRQEVDFGVHKGINSPKIIQIQWAAQPYQRMGRRVMPTHRVWRYRQHSRARTALRFLCWPWQRDHYSCRLDVYTNRKGNTMRYFAFAASLLAAVPAYADGPGHVTTVRSHSAGFPYCLKFSTNNGPTVYGFSINPANNPSVDDDRWAVRTSLSTVGETLSFNVGPAIPDCPPNVVSVSSVTFMPNF